MVVGHGTLRKLKGEEAVGRIVYRVAWLRQVVKRKMGSVFAPVCELLDMV